MSSRARELATDKTGPLSPCTEWGSQSTGDPVPDPKLERLAQIEGRALVITATCRAQELLRIPCPEDSDCDQALAIAWAPGGDRLATASPKQIELWNLAGEALPLVALEYASARCSGFRC